MAIKGLLESAQAPIRDYRAWIRDHIRREQVKTVGSLLLISLLIWAFVALAGEVMGGDTRMLDEQLFMALHDADGSPLGGGTVEEMGRDATALGGSLVLVTVTLAVLGFLALYRRWKDAAIVAVSIGTGLLASLLLKELFNRPRPDLVPHMSHVVTSSFPSGHSMVSALTYLTLGVLVAEMAERKRQVIYPLIVALILTGLVGLSRVHVGVHWPTDVLGGWIIGAAWALLCWTVLRWLQRRRALIDEDERARTPHKERDHLVAHEDDPREKAIRQTDADPVA